MYKTAVLCTKRMKLFYASYAFYAFYVWLFIFRSRGPLQMRSMRGGFMAWGRTISYFVHKTTKVLCIKQLCMTQWTRLNYHVQIEPRTNTGDRRNFVVMSVTCSIQKQKSSESWVQPETVWRRSTVPRCATVLCVLCVVVHGHGHGHGIFILATYPVYIP